MKKAKLALRSFRLKNFKAVRDSGEITFSPLTVFIGNNGSGKSSIIEGLETFQAVMTDGLDRAMEQWRGFEHIWNKAVPHTRSKQAEYDFYSNPVSFAINGNTATNIPIHAEMELAKVPGTFEDSVIIRREKLTARKHVEVTRDWTGAVSIRRNEQEELTMRDKGESCLKRWLMPIQQDEWQFLSMHPQAMGVPRPQRRSGGNVALEKDGSNVAEYLGGIRKISQDAFDGIVETLRFVLPYAQDLQPAITSELERNVYLQLTEGGFKVPGWLLSTGTMRLVALLALLRHPTPPPLIVIEEIENGLDPRAIHLVIDEIREAVQSGRTQVVLTTHSPYFLNLVPLQTIVLVERDANGEPHFWRPADEEEVKEWGKKFAPGELYTTGRFKRGRR